MTLSRINHLGAAAPTTITAPITALSTSLPLASGTGYPTSNFVIKLDVGTSSEEKILVGSRSGTTCSSLTRGYDGTSPASHSSGATVEHDLAAVVIDDANDHIYTTTRDDHPQYARTDGTRAATGSWTFNNGVTVASGGLTVSAGGAAITGNSSVSGILTATAHIATGTGTNGRYVGQTNGAPTAGTYIVGDFANDPTNGCFWICVTAGTSGTWEPVGGRPANNYIGTSETTTSTTYADLATVGPSVTVVTGTSALVMLTGTCSNNTGSIQTWMGFAVSGATTTAASDSTATLFQPFTANAFGTVSGIYVASLTPGSNTFTAKYRVGSGKGTYENRSLTVIPL